MVMKLDLDRAPSGRSQVEVGEALALREAAGSPVQARLSGCLIVDNLEGRLVVTGELRATSEVECDRCLEPFALDYPVPVEILILRDAAGQEEDGWVIHQRQGEVDLAPALREAALLALPQKRLCRSECLGICPTCGQNRNLGSCTCEEVQSDPRWEGLP
jgi:uncharacterized protein